MDDSGEVEDLYPMYLVDCLQRRSCDSELYGLAQYLRPQAGFLNIWIPYSTGTMLRLRNVITRLDSQTVVKSLNPSMGPKRARSAKISRHLLQLV